MASDPPLNQSRRAFLKTTGLAVGGLGAAGTASAHDDDDDRYVIKQDSRCFRIKPLKGHKRVEDFYKWGKSKRYFSSTGTKSLQRKDTSILFLYDGPKGLSLVIVHGALKDGSDGGAVSFKIKDIPRKAKWVVKDDYYDKDSNYDRWDIEKRSAEIDWTWKEERTDGGALRGLDVDDLNLTIYPKFNEEAKLYGKHYDGHIDRWEVLSGDRKDPDRYRLKRDEKVRLKRGRCDDDDHHHDDDDDWEDHDRDRDHHDDDKDWDDHDKERDRDKDHDHDRDDDDDKDWDDDHDKDHHDDDKDWDDDHDKDHHDDDKDWDDDHDKDRDHHDRDRDHDDRSRHDDDDYRDKDDERDRDRDKDRHDDDDHRDRDGHDRDRNRDHHDDEDDEDDEDDHRDRDENNGRKRGKKRGKERSEKEDKKDKRGPPEHSSAPDGAGPPN
ncbi:hypothetical protein KTS45_12740 [Halomicroarcula limicola]|uniref:Twin-arginine translocation signal domain-containing protein n=1 Tax=Haloarcula limicola TaxID=1429915 RepID=A0A8J8C5C1_9EURY|nr:hypothetical protein [Halomicroarcula limicola]MBV0925064.1 hypothetical protein [Halomicroarcula limicola]